MNKVEQVARILEPQAWRALGLCDTLAYKNRRTSSLRKARAAIEAMREPDEAMNQAGERLLEWDSVDAAKAGRIWEEMIDAALTEP